MKFPHSSVLFGLLGCTIGVFIGGFRSTTSQRAEIPHWTKAEVQIPIDAVRARFANSRKNQFPNANDTQVVGTDMGITSEDQQRNDELWALRFQGECVLELESPVARKQLAFAAARSAEQRLERLRSAGLDGIIRDSGMPPEQVALFERHLSKIAQASVEAEGALFQLSQARDQFQSRISTNFTPEVASRLKSLELSLRSQHDINGFSTYMQSRGIDVGDQSLGMIANLITETGAVTYESIHGPFDGIPSPAAGDRPVIEKLDREIQQMKVSKQRALDAGVERGFQADLLTRLDEYYSERIRSAEAELRSVSTRLDPVEKAKQTAELIAKIRRK